MLFLLCVVGAVTKPKINELRNEATEAPKDTRGRVSALLQELDSRMDTEEANDLMLDQTLSMGKDRRRRIPAPQHTMNNNAEKLSKQFADRLQSDGSQTPAHQKKIIDDTKEEGEMEINTMRKNVDEITTPAVEKLSDKVLETDNDFNTQKDEINDKTNEALQNEFEKLHSGNGNLFSTAADINSEIGTAKETLDDAEADAEEVMEEQTDNSLEAISDGVSDNKDKLADLKDVASEDASDAKDEQKDIESDVRDEVGDFKNDAAATMATDNEVIAGADILNKQISADRINNNKVLKNVVDQHKVVTHKVEQMLQRMMDGVTDADLKEQKKVSGNAAKGLTQLEKDAAKTNKAIGKATDMASKASAKGMSDVAAEALMANQDVAGQQTSIARALNADIKGLDNLQGAISDEASEDQEKIGELGQEGSAEIKGDFDADSLATEKEEEAEQRTRDQNDKAVQGLGSNLNDGLQKDADKVLADLQGEGGDIKVTNTQNQNRNNGLLNDASKQANDFPSKDSVDLNSLTSQEEARNNKFTQMIDEIKQGSLHDLEQAAGRSKGITAKVSGEITKLQETDKGYLEDKLSETEQQGEESYASNKAQLDQFMESLTKQAPDPELMKKASDLDFQKADLTARLQDQLSTGADNLVDSYEGIQTKYQRASETDAPAIVDTLPTYAANQLAKVLKETKGADNNLTETVDQHVSKQEERREKDVAYFNGKASQIKSKGKAAADALGEQADEIAAQGKQIKDATESDVHKAEQAVDVLQRETTRIYDSVKKHNADTKAEIKLHEDNKVAKAMDTLSPLVEKAKEEVEKLTKQAAADRSKLLLAGKGDMETAFADLQGKADAASEQAATWETLMGAAETQLNNIQGNARAMWSSQIGHVAMTEKVQEAALEGMKKKMQSLSEMLEQMLGAVSQNLDGASGEAASSIKSTYERVQSVIQSLADNAEQETKSRSASLSGTVTSLMKRATAKNQENRALAEEETKRIQAELAAKKDMQARLSERLVEADNEVRTDEMLQGNSLREAGSKENEANDGVVDTGIDLADLAGAGVMAANKATAAAGAAGEKDAMAAMQQVQLNKHGEQAQSEEFAQETARNKHNADSALKQETQAIDHSKIIEESTAKNAEERFAELSQHIDDELDAQAKTVKRIDGQVEGGVKGQLTSMDEGVNDLMRAAHDLELSMHASEAKREKFDADLEKVQSFEHNHDENEVKDVYGRSQSLDFSREDLSHWMNHFISQDMKFKAAVDKAFKKEEVYMDSGVMGALNTLNQQRIDEQNAKSSVHRAFESKLAEHEQKTEAEIAAIYAKRDELLRQLDADDSLDAKRKAVLMAQIKATADAQAKQLRRGAGDMKSQVADMKSTWENFQRLTKQALASSDNAMAAHAAMSVGDHLVALKKKVQGLVGGSKWFSMIQLNGKEMPFFTHLTDESLADLADKAEKMELRSERAKHRVQVQDPEYAQELVKLANKDAALESQLS